jgi:hypothetical protein
MNRRDADVAPTKKLILRTRRSDDIIVPLTLASDPTSREGGNR